MSDTRGMEDLHTWLSLRRKPKQEEQTPIGEECENPN